MTVISSNVIKLMIKFERKFVFISLFNKTCRTSRPYFRLETHAYPRVLYVLNEMKPI